MGQSIQDHIDTLRSGETWWPTPYFRWYTPNERLVPSRLERKFRVRAECGVETDLWYPVDEDNLSSPKGND